KFSGDMSLEEKKEKESKPASNLHEKLKNPDEKIDEVRDQSMPDQNPFEDEDHETHDNPFEA
ncbi:MAG: hypothetical protein ABEJ98_02455, partial [Candidatus Nanohaloarchaea archaeon]